MGVAATDGQWFESDRRLQEWQGGAERRLYPFSLSSLGERVRVRGNGLA